MRNVSTAARGLRSYARATALTGLAVILLLGCQWARTPAATPSGSANSIVPGRSELIGPLTALPEGSFQVKRRANLTRVEFPLDAPSEHDPPEAPTPTPFPRLTLDQILKGMGTPERVYGWLERGGTFICQVVMLEYPTRGLRVESFSCGNLVDVRAWDYRGNWFRASPDLPVSRIDYFSPGSWEKVLRTVYGLTDREVRCLVSKPRWQGLEKVPEVSECRIPLD